MKKLNVIDAKGKKTFESMANIKKWYSFDLNTNHYEDTFFYSREIWLREAKLKLFLSYVFIDDKVYKISAKFYSPKDELIGTAAKAAMYVNKICGEKYQQTAKDFETRITETINMIQMAKNRELFASKFASFKKDFEDLMKKYNFEMEINIWGEYNEYADLDIIDKKLNARAEFISNVNGNASIVQ